MFRKSQNFSLTTTDEEQVIIGIVRYRKENFEPDLKKVYFKIAMFSIHIPTYCSCEFNFLHPLQNYKVLL